MKEALPTTGEIARRLDVPLHRVEYIIRAHGIVPVGWAGNARVFSEEDVARVADLLGKTGPEPRKAVGT